MIRFTHKKAAKEIKVKLVAVAKDEAAYLPEWVHHHLYFGFDEIEVYVNRSIDNSLDVLNKISVEHPQVKFTTADWVDLCPDAAKKHIQQIVYSLALHKAKTEELFDYIMFIDVDEFYMPADMQTGIKDKIGALKYPDSISFQWFNELGQDTPFSPLSRSIHGCRHRLIKSVVSTAVNVDSMSLHLPRFDGSKRLLSDGKPFKPAKGHHEQLDPALSQQRDTMIVHRMFRSPLEYVSLLSRGRPSKTRLTIKTNRFGYNIDNSEPELFEVDQAAYQPYQQSLTTFLQKCQLSNDLLIARKFVEQRYQQTLDAIPNIPVDAAKEAARAFRQCDSNVVKAINKRFGSSTFLTKSSTPLLLSDLAKMFVSIDVNTAKKLIDRALELHPTGPRIKAMHKEIMAIEEPAANV